MNQKNTSDPVRRAKPRAAKWLRRATGLAALLAAIGTTFVMIATVLDVGRRQAFNEPIPGMLEYSEVMLVVVVFLGLAYAQRNKQHVATTILTDRLTPRLATYTRFVSYLVVALTLLWMIQATGVKALDSYNRGEIRFGLARVPMWPARAAIPIGLTLFLAEVIRDLGRAWNFLRGNGHAPINPPNPDDEALTTQGSP